MLKHIQKLPHDNTYVGIATSQQIWLSPVLLSINSGKAMGRRKLKAHPPPPPPPLATMGGK